MVCSRCVFCCHWSVAEISSTGDPAATHVVARSRILDVGSRRVLALAKDCVDECARGHARCRALLASPDKDALLPTRLIDCSDPSHPRLAPTDGLRGKYYALSYVWGEPQPHSPVTSNVHAYAAGINPENLPQTIRDAIYVTHELGMQYLWADTLCIIQDSDQDKRRELARMHRIQRAEGQRGLPAGSTGHRRA